MKQKIKFRDKTYPEQELLDLARASRRAKDFQSAESACHQLYENNPRCTEAIHLSALNLYHFGAVDSAAYWLKRAINLDGEKPAYHYHLGILLTELGKKEAAEASFSRAIELKADYKIKIDKFKNYARE